MLKTLAKVVPKDYCYMFLCTLMFSSMLEANHSYSDYRDYPLTETEFKLDFTKESRISQLMLRQHGAKS